MVQTLFLLLSCTDVPQSQRLEALQTAVILLPEENREVLHCLLLFLGDIAQHADKHQVHHCFSSFPADCLEEWVHCWGVLWRKLIMEKLPSLAK